MLGEHGRPVTVVAVTDGERSHPRSTTVSPTELAARRIGEQALALDMLGLREAHVVRLRIADGGVAASSSVVESLVAHLRGTTVCFAPWRADRHPDHEATGHAAAVACAILGVPLLEYPVWAWHWARPRSSDLPWHRTRRVPLTLAARHAKQRAIEAYASQLQPLSASPGDETVVPPPVLAHFQRPFEVVMQ
jgi:LmbE family N-acetylglucosaminyl deacetylase